MSASSTLDILEEVQHTGRSPRGLLCGLRRLASWAGDVLWHIERMDELDLGHTGAELAEAYHRVENHRELLLTLQGLTDLERELRELVQDHRRLQRWAEEAVEEHTSPSGSLPPATGVRVKP